MVDDIAAWQKYAREVQQNQESYAKEVQLDARAIAQIGHAQYGSAAWDEMVDTCAGAVARRSGCDENVAQALLTDAIRQLDDPHVVVEHLHRNPDRLERIMDMPLPAQRAEFARIEAQHAPHGRAQGGKNPAWKTIRNAEGRVSDADWRTNGGANLSDAAWAKEFDRRAAEKHGIKPGRFRSASGMGTR